MKNPLKTLDEIAHIYAWIIWDTCDCSFDPEFWNMLLFNKEVHDK